MCEEISVICCRPLVSNSLGGMLNVLSLPAKPVIRRLGTTLLLLCATASAAAGQNVLGRATGLSGGFGNFDFNSLALNEGDALNSLTNTGVTVGFKGAYYGQLPSTTLYGPFSGSFGTNALYNYTFGQVSAPTMQLDFTGAASAAVFNFTTAVDPGFATSTATIKAFKNGVQVGFLQNDFAPTTAASRELFWGFQFTNGTTFDRLTIEGNPSAFGIDNLQVLKATTVVPEPSTVGLMSLGLFALGAMARRRLRAK